MRCGFIRCLCLVLLCLCSSALHAGTLLVLGDSLSAGYGIKANSGWVNLLDQRLKTEGYDYRIINASISGETTAGGKARLPALLKTHQPSIVILELGANDGLRGLPLLQLRSNLKTMIQAAQAAKAKVLLVGMQIPPNYGATYTRQFASSFSDLADTHNVKLVPFFLEKVALDSSLLQADNLHPNERAQPILLNTVWPQLKTLLSR
jgi:acyl-CoA thioesterase-1